MFAHRHVKIGHRGFSFPMAVCLAGYSFFFQPCPFRFHFRNQLCQLFFTFFFRFTGDRADAYSCFYTDMFNIAANVFGEDFSQSFTVELIFVPMMHQTNSGEVFIAEKTTFDRLVTLLRTEFYQGLAVGNEPRRCRNCGAHFF